MSSARPALPLAARLTAVAALALAASPFSPLVTPAPTQAAIGLTQQNPVKENPAEFGDWDLLAPGEKPPPVPRGERAVRIAASKAGAPYSYGGDGPGSFDCSGFTSWVYDRVGVNLPRTSAAQAGAVRRIPAGAARRGDLVFFTGGSGVYHVGIYAGARTIWHSPRTGESVKRERIWSSSVFYGRVR